MEVIPLTGAMLQEYNPDQEVAAFSIATASRVIVLKLRNFIEISQKLGQIQLSRCTNG